MYTYYYYCTPLLVCGLTRTPDWISTITPQTQQFVLEPIKANILLMAAALQLRAIAMCTISASSLAAEALRPVSSSELHPLGRRRWWARQLR